MLERLLEKFIQLTPTQAIALVSTTALAVAALSLTVAYVLVSG